MTDQLRLHDRRAIVTGGSRGIGLAIASALIAEGARVTIAARTAADLERACAQLGPGAAAAVVDVRDGAAVERLVNDAARRDGALDLLVNNAGVGVFADTVDLSPDDWYRVLDTNLNAVFHACRAAIPHLRRRGGGWIVNVSSLAGVNPFRGGAAYCASKAALDAFSHALMQEVRHDGIRVTTVAPGSVRTGFGRSEPDEADWKLAPEDVAQVVVDLVAHPARSLPSRVELRPSRPRSG